MPEVTAEELRRRAAEWVLKGKNVEMYRCAHCFSISRFRNQLQHKEGCAVKDLLQAADALEAAEKAIHFEVERFKLLRDQLADERQKREAAEKWYSPEHPEFEARVLSLVLHEMTGEQQRKLAIHVLGDRVKEQWEWIAPQGDKALFDTREKAEEWAGTWLIEGHAVRVLIIEGQGE